MQSVWQCKKTSLHSGREVWHWETEPKQGWGGYLQRQEAWHKCYTPVSVGRAPTYRGHPRIEGNWSRESKHCQGEEGIHQESAWCKESEPTEGREEGILHGVCHTLSKVKMASMWGWARTGRQSSKWVEAGVHKWGWPC